RAELRRELEEQHKYPRAGPNHTVTATNTVTVTTTIAPTTVDSTCTVDVTVTNNDFLTDAVTVTVTQTVPAIFQPGDTLLPTPTYKCLNQRMLNPRLRIPPSNTSLIETELKSLLSAGGNNFYLRDEVKNFFNKRQEGQEVTFFGIPGSGIRASSILSRVEF